MRLEREMREEAKAQWMAGLQGPGQTGPGEEDVMDSRHMS